MICFAWRGGRVGKIPLLIATGNRHGLACWLCRPTVLDSWYYQFCPAYDRGSWRFLWKNAELLLWIYKPVELHAVDFYSSSNHHKNFIPTTGRKAKYGISNPDNLLLLLLRSVLLTERCRTDDLLPDLPVPCLPPRHVDSKVLGWTSSLIVLSQVVLGRPTGLLQSDGGRSAAETTRWWSSSWADRTRWPAIQCRRLNEVMYICTQTHTDSISQICNRQFYNYCHCQLRSFHTAAIRRNIATAIFLFVYNLVSHIIVS